MKILKFFLLSIISLSNATKLEYTTTLQLIRLPLLIYDYNKKYNYTSVKDIKSDIQILNELSNYAPNGQVKLFLDNPKSGLQAGITKSDKFKRICVVFRGSEEKLDWYHNLLAWKYKLPNHKCKVHKGFYKQLNDYDNFIKISDQLKLEISENPSYSVYILGHSLGGALASIFGFLYANTTNNFITVISFASPRVGDKKFKELFENQTNLRHYRFTNKHDVVPNIPIINYHHTGIHINIKNNKFKIGKKNTVLNSFSIKDHDINDYYENLKKSKGWDSLNLN